MGLLVKFQKYDVIWMIVNQLTKTEHIILIKVDYTLEKLSFLNVDYIIQLDTF